MAVISFARGAPAPECLDEALIADCARAALERDGTTILSYGAGGGYGPLRELLAEQHGVDPGRVFLTTGGPPGIRLLCGRAAGAPTWSRARRGTDVRPAAQDPGTRRRGGRPARDGRRGSRPRRARSRAGAGGTISFLYTIPTFQNPSGRSIGTERRRRLAGIAAEYDLPILEDDPYGRVRYEGEALPLLHEIEGGERVTFTSSFSKTVAPGLRIGYFVVPQGLVAAYDDRAVSTYISPSLLPQATVHELMQRGAFVPNLDRIRGLLRARKDAMLAALAAEMPAGTTWSTPEGGYFLWVDFAAGTDSAALLARATEAGVTFVGAPTSSRMRRRASRLRASRSATRRRSASPKASHSSPRASNNPALGSDLRLTPTPSYGLLRRRRRRSRTSSKSQPARKPSAIASSRTTKSDASVLKKTKFTATGCGWPARSRAGRAG